MSLTLYYHPLSSFCHKPLVALYENGTAFEKRLIDLSKEADRAELAVAWPLIRFPVLRDDARKCHVPESSIIMEYLDRHYPGAQPLIPNRAEDALEVRLWDRIFDNYVQVPMQRIVADRGNGANADMTRERALLQAAYAMIDRQLAAHPWIVAGAFSMADCAAAPALYFANLVAPFGKAHEPTAVYLGRLMARPSFARAVKEAAPYLALVPK